MKISESNAVTVRYRDRGLERIEAELAKAKEPRTVYTLYATADSAWSLFNKNRDNYVNELAKADELRNAALLKLAHLITPVPKSKGAATPKGKEPGKTLDQLLPFVPKGIRKKFSKKLNDIIEAKISPENFEKARARYHSALRNRATSLLDYLPVGPKEPMEFKEPSAINPQVMAEVNAAASEFVALLFGIVPPPPPFCPINYQLSAFPIAVKAALKYADLIEDKFGRIRRTRAKRLAKLHGKLMEFADQDYFKLNLHSPEMGSNTVRG